MALGTCELIWIKSLLSDMGIKVDEPVYLRCDNQAAIYIRPYLVFHERTKHI
jgi:hypothetical protein